MKAIDIYIITMAIVTLGGLPVFFRTVTSPSGRSKQYLSKYGSIRSKHYIVRRFGGLRIALGFGSAFYPIGVAKCIADENMVAVGPSNIFFSLLLRTFIIPLSDIEKIENSGDGIRVITIGGSELLTFVCSNVQDLLLFFVAQGVIVNKEIVRSSYWTGKKRQSKP